MREDAAEALIKTVSDAYLEKTGAELLTYEVEIENGTEIVQF